MLFLFPLIFASVLARQTPFEGSTPMAKSFQLKATSDIFSPQDLIELPKPSGGVANPAGDLALVLVSKYSSSDKETHKSLWLAPLNSAISPFEIPLAKGGDVVWLDSRTVAHIVPDEVSKGQEIYAISVKYDPQLSILNTPEASVLIGSFPPAIDAANFMFSADSSILIFSAQVWPDHDLSTVKSQDDDYEKRGNTALVYDETYARHWDTWRGPKSSGLFTTSLKQQFDGQWALGTTYNSLLKGTGHKVPVEPFGGTDDFAISASHVIYTTKDPKLPEAWHTRQNVYAAPLDASSPPVELTSGSQGATRSPVISHSGDLVAWLELEKDGYEADRAQLILYSLSTSKRLNLTSSWDRTPESLAFDKDDKSILLTAGDVAHVKVYRLPIPGADVKLWGAWKEIAPTALTHSHAASALQPLSDGRLLFTQNSLTSPNDLFILSSTSSDGKISRITDFSGPLLKDKKLDEGESFLFEGAEGKTVQGWAVKPPGFKKGETKKWPVVLLIHGGPQGAWEDQWSTRWNPNIFAQQGYFVIAINPTGSTTFGQEFTDAIAQDWGGKPFVDMQKGWKYALNAFPEIDSDRAVAAGASWGGYAINWIQGHPEYGFGFKALVCHDGMFDAPYNGYSTDELFFFNHDFGGPPYSDLGKDVAAKFNPAQFVARWSTPELLFHGSKDYRLAETESLGAFHALQGRGIPSRLVIFPDENHWVLKPGNSLKWHYELFRWFDQFVGENA